MYLFLLLSDKIYQNLTEADGSTKLYILYVIKDTKAFSHILYLFV